MTPLLLALLFSAGPSETVIDASELKPPYSVKYRNTDIRVPPKSQMQRALERCAEFCLGTEIAAFSYDAKTNTFSCSCK